MIDRIGASTEINGRTVTVTEDGVLLSGKKRAELLLMREHGELTQDRLDGLQAAVRLNLGRCASLSTGDALPCRHWPKAGAILCPTHGGRVPSHLARAERVLAAIRLPALEWLARQIDQADADQCDECGYPKQGLKERKYIASLVWRLLDRAGLPPTKKVEVVGDTSKDVTLDGWTVEEKRELAAKLGEIRLLKSRVETRLLQDEAAKNLAIPAERIPRRVLEAAHTGVRPPEGELDPLDE